jgi:two-component system nitrogen regulation sensor histidine kinase GlnL
VKTSPPYENIIEYLGEGVICVDPANSIVVFNQAAERFTGLSRGKVVGKVAGDALSVNPWLVELLERTMKEEKLFTEYEETLRGRHSEPVPVSVTTSHVFDDEGNLSGAVARVKDLSGIKSIETETLRKERLELLGTFAVNLAHEVKNPLGGIRGAAQLLSRKVQEAGLEEYTDVIINTVDRLDAIVGEMLDFARPGKIEKMALNIHKVLDESILLLGAASGAPEIVREYDPSLPLVLGDADKLTQLFLNLIKNAYEAVGDGGGGGGSIRVITRIVTDFHLVDEGTRESKLAAVVIRDTGCGIEPKDLEKIFTPFFTTKPGGSGLGMPLSYRIIKEHDGFLKIVSKPGEGTRVVVYLPTQE